MGKGKLTTIHKFDGSRTGEPHHQAQTQYETEPGIHVSVSLRRVQTYNSKIYSNTHLKLWRSSNNKCRKKVVK